MKRILILSVISLFLLPLAAAQISLNGVVTVQNSKVNTGKTEYVSNAQVYSQNTQPNITDSQGKFSLRFAGVESGRQVQISVTPYGVYKDFMVVNDWDLNPTLGRKSWVSIYLAKQADLDARKAEMVGINMKNIEERADRIIKRLQSELEIYKNNSDYMNVRYKEIRDSLLMVNNDIANAYKMIEEYAKSLVTINLDEKEDNYIKAYNCFAKGELDSVRFYLNAEELDKKYQNLMQLKEESEKEKTLVQILTTSATLKEERLVAGMNDLIKEWLLLAQTAALQNKYEETQTYYEKVINADSLHAENLFEYAEYLKFIREYIKAERYYLKCLEIRRALERENPNQYLPVVAQTLNCLGNLHKATKEYSMAMAEYEESYKIYNSLAKEEPQSYSFFIAQSLNNLGALYIDIKEYQKGLKVSEDALEVFSFLTQGKSDLYTVNIGTTLHNLGIIYFYLNKYSKAQEEFEKALALRRSLAEENPKLYLSDVAQTLNCLAYLHQNLSEYSKANDEFEETLEIYRKLAAHNPKAYLADVAQVLNNLGFLHAISNEHQNALESYDEALGIYRKLTEEHPKAYLLTTATLLLNIAYSKALLYDYSKVLEEYNEVLTIYRQFEEENPKTFTFDIGITLLNLSEVRFYSGEYKKALEASIEAWDIFSNLLDENQRYLVYATSILHNISGCYLYLKEYAQAEQYARKGIELDNNVFYKINLAHALLLQMRYDEAEHIYIEISQTQNEDNESYTPSILDDLEKLEKAGAIPEKCKTDVEKIRNILK